MFGLFKRKTCFVSSFGLEEVKRITTFFLLLKDFLDISLDSVDSLKKDQNLK